MRKFKFEATLPMMEQVCQEFTNIKYCGFLEDHMQTDSMKMWTAYKIGEDGNNYPITIIKFSDEQYSFACSHGTYNCSLHIGKYSIEIFNGFLNGELITDKAELRYFASSAMKLYSLVACGYID